MGQHDRERRERSLRRNPWKKVPRKLILVTCEGKKTESIYLEAVRVTWRISTAEIRVVPLGMTPSRVVKDAIDRKEERHREARKGNEVDYDEVWCVFDRNTHGDLNAARQLAKSHNIRVALSVPCFEIWYLLHFVFTTRQFRDYDELERVLKEHIPHYDKTRNYTETLLSRLDAAFQNTRQLRRFNEDNGTTCPATDVDRLVQVMKSIAES
jgi:hypothetical protein